MPGFDLLTGEEGGMTTQGTPSASVTPRRPLYCSPGMVSTELPLDLPATAFGNEDFVRRIEMWSGYIDDYMSSVYEVPFATWPATPSTIQVACKLLVTYDSYVLAGLPSEKDDPRQSLWGRAHDLLDKIKGREITLTDNDGDPLTNPTRSTLPMGIGPANGPASFSAQAGALGPIRGRWGGSHEFFEGGYGVASLDGDGGREIP